MSKLSKPNLSNLLESFFRQRLVAQRSASPDTVAAYRDGLRLFLIFAAESFDKPPSRLAVDDLDRDIVLAFLDYLEKNRGNCRRTRNTRLIALRSFYHHVAYCDPALMNLAQRVISIPTKRTTRRVVNYLRQEELDKILAAPDRNTYNGRRHYALLLFLSRTGARVSEATGLNAIDLRFRRPWQVLIYGKGSKQRLVPIAKDTAAVLQSLCDECGVPLNSKSPVFLNAKGQRLTRFGVVHILNKAILTASKAYTPLGDCKISPHTLRHTLAMNLLQSGVDLTTIQSWLGHVSIKTTHHYVEANVEMKRQALEKCSIPETKPYRYQPKDKILALLESLKN